MEDAEPKRNVPTALKPPTAPAYLIREVLATAVVPHLRRLEAEYPQDRAACSFPGSHLVYLTW